MWFLASVEGIVWAAGAISATENGKPAPHAFGAVS